MRGYCHSERRRDCCVEYFRQAALDDVDNDSDLAVYTVITRRLNKDKQTVTYLKLKFCNRFYGKK
jgi:hypothetical protein